MKKIWAVVLLGMFLFWAEGFSQDNIYGDYLFTVFEKRVSLDLEGAQLVDVLKMLSQQTKLNFVSTEAVKDRTLTLYMENVPLKEAMDIIFKANNLAYDYYPDAKIFVVKEMGKPTLELKTKVYPLKYVRVKSSQMQKEIKDVIEPEEEEEEKVKEEEEGIKVAVEAVLSEQGKVREDPITNSLIVVDVPSQFPLIEEVINSLDVPISKVMIEVELLDVSKSHLDKIGFNFANGLYASWSGPQRTSRFPFPRRLGGEKGAVTLGTLDLTSFTLVMQFLTEDITTKLLARPKILTLSNETAEISLTMNEAIGLTTTSVEGGITSQEVERGETGTKLRVTPQVNLGNREISLFVNIFNRESLDSGLAVTGLTGEIKNIEERGTKNMIRLKDGETLYIGGLIRKEDKETVRKIPFLGDIPLIGRLFRYVYRPGIDNADRELLVFLTPHIIEEKPFVSKKAVIPSREQQDFAKREAIKLALDKFTP